MTTKIYSRAWLNHLEIDNSPTVGLVTLRISDGESAVTCVSTADLAAALGLVTREEHEAKLTASNRTVSALRADLDQANAREGAVREAMHSNAAVFSRQIADALDSEWKPVTADQIREGDEVLSVNDYCGVHGERHGIAGRLNGNYWVSGEGVGITGWANERLYRREKPTSFVLPTEVPATITAKRNGDPRKLTLRTDGYTRWWHDERVGNEWTEQGVMEIFTDHKLAQP